MATTDAYGPMFQTLANRFKQHVTESNARASAQADLSRTKSTPVSTSYGTARRPSYVSTECTSASHCPCCHLVRRTSPTSPVLHSSAHHHIHDECFGSFCPDIAVPNGQHSPTHARNHHRRPSLLADKERDSSDDSSSSNYTSPSDSRASVDPPEHRHLSKCQCGNIKPTENLDERYGE